MNNLKYLIIYTSVLIVPSVVLSGCFRHKIDLWDYGWFYVTYLLLGIAASFGNKRTQNLCLLFQMPLLVSEVSSTVFFSLLKIGDVPYMLATTILCSLLFYLWHVFYNKVVSPFQILVTLICGDLFVFLSVILYHRFDLHDILNNLSGSLSVCIVYYIGWGFMAIFCSMKSKVARWLSFGSLVVYGLIAVMYLQPAIYSKLLFGTFSGKTEEPVSFRLYTEDGKILDSKEFLKGCHVCLIWRTQNPWDTRRFEQMAKLCSNRKANFSIIGWESSGSADTGKIRQAYRTLHLKLPLYRVVDDDMRNTPVMANCEQDYICVFRNDTLIYKGELDAKGKTEKIISNITRQ